MRARIVQWKEREVAVRDVQRQDPTQAMSPNCEPSHAHVFAGHGQTHVGGSWTIDLGAINCLPPGPAHNRQPSVVATPTGTEMTDDIPRPVILMARTHGAQITIWSLDPGGGIVPNVHFSWHCVIEGEWVE